MITLYTSPTPNGHKASILLEELGVSYRVHRLDLAAGENKGAEYLKISPIGKMPAILEELPGGVQRRLFGSGAILMHYAEHTGRLLPQGEARGEALSWMMLGISDLGPTAMDMFRFSVRAPEKIPYAIDLYKGELLRCYQALDDRLKDEEYLAGEYSIADISCFTFIAVAASMGGRLLERYANMKRWHDAIIARPAVQRGLAVPE